MANTDNIFHWAGAIVVTDKIRAVPSILTWMRGAVIDVPLTELSCPTLHTQTLIASWVVLWEKEIHEFIYPLKPFTVHVLYRSVGNFGARKFSCVKILC